MHAHLLAQSLLLSLAQVAASSGATPSPLAAAPRFERAACAVEVEPDERIDCGVLTVAESRGKADSRTIQLPVMIFRSRAAVPAGDPVLFVAGGPGGSAVAGQRSGRRNILLDERDFIVLEPRGARHAQPALECPETNALKGEIAAGRLRGDAERAALADDIEDLRKALGYDKWNLLAVSYGTRPALTVLRRHAGGVRSVVLDSVLPPDVNFDEVATSNLQRILSLVFDGCAIDRDCGAAHPDLRRVFANLVAAADRAPLPLVLDVADTGGGPPRFAVRRS